MCIYVTYVSILVYVNEYVNEHVYVSVNTYSKLLQESAAA
jgi:hypothetical protein